MKHRHYLALASLCLGSAAFAGGYQVALQGQRQIGMGHTGTGLAMDASSIFFNPGALSFSKKNNLMVGASFIRSRVNYLAPQEANAPSNYNTTTESPLGTPFTLYASYGKKDSKLKFGLGVYTPYGSSVKWAEDWKGYSVLQELSLQAICFQPTISYKISKIGFGAGFVYSMGSVDLKKGIGSLATANGYSSAQLKGDAMGFGYNVGVYVDATSHLTLGASYRSRIDMKVDGGTATFNVPPSAVALGRFPSGGTKFDATLPLPATLSLGIGFKPNEKLTIAVDYNRVFWSAYDSLKFEYEQAVNGAMKTSSPRRYQDASIYRIGLEYMATPSLAMRCGYYFDESPVKDGYMTPETPDANRHAVSVGLGYKVGEIISVDASFLWIEGTEREQKQSDIDPKAQDSFVAGTYKLRAFIPGLSLSLHF